MIKNIISITLLCFSFNCFSETLITYRNSDSVNDARFNYEIQLLALALNKTRTEYGAFQLNPSPSMNAARAINSAEKNAYTNFFMLASFKEIYNKNMIYIPIPLQRGIVGYRVFLTSNTIEEKLQKLDSVEQLKKLTVVQGKGWQDVNILKSNGFNVTTLSHYDSMFQFVSRQRADIFPRGISEYEFELAYHKPKSPNLVLDSKYVLYYEFPRFFYTHKNNTKAFERIKKGLEIAWEDGSFIELWTKFHEKAITKVNLPNRQRIKLINPEMKYLPHDITKYMYMIQGK